jgi:hypothetical protein
MHTTLANNDDEERKQCVFLTLFPAHYGTQLACIQDCHTQIGWYPTHLYLHPERYEYVGPKRLYLPLSPTPVVPMNYLTGTPPILESFPVVQVEICSDTTGKLKWYQVQCVRHPSC